MNNSELTQLQQDNKISSLKDPKPADGRAYSVIYILKAMVHSESRRISRRGEDLGKRRYSAGMCGRKMLLRSHMIDKSGRIFNLGMFHVKIW